VYEIFGNVASLIAFGMSAKDSQVLRKELLAYPYLPVDAGPVSLEALVTLRTGQAVARLGGDAYAVRLETTEPFEPAWRGERVQATSWERYGTSLLRGALPSERVIHTRSVMNSLSEVRALPRACSNHFFSVLRRLVIDSRPV
jgi:hypothetical protein